MTVKSTFTLLGYSQGAHIAGDLATTIATEGSPISAERVRSVRLLADPARNAAFPDLVGMDDGGAGGMFADRGDFGALNDRVTEYCTELDMVCNLTSESIDQMILALVFQSGPHTSYSVTKVPGTDQTFTDRITSDLVQDIVNLNHATY